MNYHTCLFLLVTRKGFEPLILAVKGRCPSQLDGRAIWCLWALSGRRHAAFQATALPSELQRHVGICLPADATGMVGREGFEPSVSLTWRIYSPPASPLAYRPIYTGLTAGFGMVTCMRLELIVSALRGRRPKPIRRAGHIGEEYFTVLYQHRTIRSSRLT